MPEIKIEVDKDTLAALALGAMHDGVTMNEYVTACVVELSKVIETVVTAEGTDEVVDEVPGKAPVQQPAVEDNIGTAPTIEQANTTTVTPQDKPGGQGAPLYGKKETNRWTI